MKNLILVILLSGCGYNGYNDPNILWPITWGVDNHRVKAEQIKPMTLKRPGLNICAIYG